MTPTQYKALEIVRDHPGIDGAEFAHRMWPDSDGWSKVSKAGNYGSRMGAGMPRAGGSYLAVLHRKGLLHRRSEPPRYRAEYTISDSARVALAARSATALLNALNRAALAAHDHAGEARR